METQTLIRLLVGLTMTVVVGFPGSEPHLVVDQA